MTVAELKKLKLELEREYLNNREYLFLDGYDDSTIRYSKKDLQDEASIRSFQNTSKLIDNLDKFYIDVIEKLSRQGIPLNFISLNSKIAVAHSQDWVDELIYKHDSCYKIYGDIAIDKAYEKLKEQIKYRVLPEIVLFDFKFNYDAHPQLKYFQINKNIFDNNSAKGIVNYPNFIYELKDRGYEINVNSNVVKKYQNCWNELIDNMSKQFTRYPEIEIIANFNKTKVKK